jgi:2-polyprenyl-3-methyl-5-hydroxy-6-metoxy-1,4-benzoquinol methylase
MNKKDPDIVYWDDHSDEFDAIYTHDKSGFSNLLDSIFRRDMYQRFEFTMEKSQPITGRSFLDIGCGPGHYSLALAKRGAGSVTGIDYSEKMIEMANNRLAAQNLKGSCRFLVKDIIEFDSKTQFDVSIAMGLFDYTKDPLPILTKMQELTTSKMILSFPRLYTWRAPIRRVRLRLKKLDVYFYSKNRLKSIFNSAGFKKYEMVKIGKLHCVVIFLE